MKALPYFRSCVTWPRVDVYRAGGLYDMIDCAIEISRRTFLRHVKRADLATLEKSLGYSAHPSQGMTMAGDCHVSYYRSKLHGRRVYYFLHSSIEYVFGGYKV